MAKEMQRTLKKQATLKDTREGEFTTELHQGSEVLDFFETEEKLYEALKALRTPTLLMKYGKGGGVFIRSFFVSQYFDRIEYISPTKLAAEVYFKDVETILKGMQTEKFKKKKRPEYEGRSFSLVYKRVKKNKIKTQTMDIICKDAQEFNTWYHGLKACVTAIRVKYDLTSLDQKFRNLEIINEHIREDVFLKTLKQPQKQFTSLENREINDLYFWGSNDVNQCGFPTSSDKSEKILDPIELTYNKNTDPVALALGYNHSLLLLDNGEVISFGCSHNGRLGHEDVLLSMEDAILPKKIASFKTKIVSISCGDFHSAAIDEFGEAFTWGCNYEGQLGFGDCSDRFIPERLAPTYFNDCKVAAIRCGGNFTAALTREGNVYTCGKNKFFAIGLVGVKNKSVFERMENIGQITQIACGGFHMLAYSKEKNELYSWGWNDMGQLGTGENTYEERIRKCISPWNDREGKIVQIECGLAFSAALVMEKNIRCVYTWGSNSNNQLGTGINENCNIPRNVEVLNVEAISQISTGMLHMGAVSETGQLFMWGDGMNGVLGNHNTAGCKFPSELNYFSEKSVKLIACGGTHTGGIIKRVLDLRKLANECKSCKTKLDSIFKRKYLCRNCGEVFCKNCTSIKKTSDKLGLVQPERVCDRCYDSL